MIRVKVGIIVFSQNQAGELKFYQRKVSNFLMYENFGISQDSLGHIYLVGGETQEDETQYNTQMFVIDLENTRHIYHNEFKFIAPILNKGDDTELKVARSKPQVQIIKDGAMMVVLGGHNGVTNFIPTAEIIELNPYGDNSRSEGRLLVHILVDLHIQGVRSNSIFHSYEKCDNIYLINSFETHGGSINSEYSHITFEDGSLQISAPGQL